ncbi:GntR family transcriptional regulator [Anaeroselena agilis]|uniref:GntR family transcriptional regulator n=1 Tax=Anaeroselena agilis TaxID=3063788 RepID=A0ABU3P0K5_9FIRM|nr:GntR family transcriptional regulator [Selenomonadales bacterium 4137-cl]
MRNNKNLIPAYYRLADDIKRQIETGELKDGDMIPTEGQLGETYGISRMTVRHGLALLAEAGLIETVKGKGTFVHRPRLNQLVIDLQESAAIGAEKCRYKLLGVKLIRDEHYIKELKLAPDGKVFLLKRVLYKENKPVGVEEKYLPYLRATPLLETQLEYANFSEVVAKHQETVPVRNDMVISVDVLNAEQARLLEAEVNTPALVIKQVIYSKDDTPLGISHMVCHKDRFQLKATSYTPF